MEQREQTTLYISFTHEPLLFSDGVPTVLAAEWDTSTAMFDGETARGPVPRFFATNPAEAKDNLNSDPARAHKDLQSICPGLPSTRTYQLTRRLS